MAQNYLKLLIVGCILLISSCSPEPCGVDYYYLSPTNMVLNIGQPDTTIYGHVLILQNTFADSITVKDSIFINDSLVIKNRKEAIYKCSIDISTKHFTLKAGDAVEYGNSEPDWRFNRIGVTCESIDLTNGQAFMTIRKGRFCQDCSDWNN